MFLMEKYIVWIKEIYISNVSYIGVYFKDFMIFFGVV